MREVKMLALGISALLFCSALVFAQVPEQKAEPMTPEKAVEKPMEKDAYAGMMANALGVFQKQMVATSDGGVVVLAGNKLLKYDKDLNLIKEAEVKAGTEFRMDAGSIQDMMKMMKEKYGKHKEEKEEEGQVK